MKTQMLALVLATAALAVAPDLQAKGKGKGHGQGAAKSQGSPQIKPHQAHGFGRDNAPGQLKRQGGGSARAFQHGLMSPARPDPRSYGGTYRAPAGARDRHHGYRAGPLGGYYAYNGLVLGGLLAPWGFLHPPTPPPLLTGSRVAVATVSLNVRSGPGTRYPVMTAVGYGTVLHVIAASRGWLQIRIGAGYYGWVSGSLVVPVP